MLAHRELGAGPRTVLFVHGLFGRGRDLEAFAGRLLEGDPRMRGLVPDLLAHGDSPAVPAGANLGTMADALVDWLNRLGVRERVPVVAHSMGGRVALRCEERHHGRLGPFVLLDTPAGAIAEKRSPLSPFLRALAAAPDRADSEESLLAPFERVMMGPLLRAWVCDRVVSDSDGVRWNFDRQALVEYRNNTMREELWDVVARLGAGEIGVFAPKQSVYLRRDERERYASCGIEVHSIAGARHDLYQSMPEAFLRQIRARISSSAG